jgi:hypothetical protein
MAAVVPGSGIVDDKIGAALGSMAILFASHPSAAIAGGDDHAGSR